MTDSIGCSFCIPRPGCGDCAKRSMGKPRARADDVGVHAEAWALYVNPHRIRVPRRRAAADYEKAERIAKHG